MVKETRYDVFLSHNSADKPAVEAIAHRLREEAHLEPFLDKWHLVPGEPWQEALEDAIDVSRSCAVFLGPAGMGSWENEEMRATLDIRVKQPDFRVIPVLLPGASLPERGRLPRFLSRLTWVDFRSGLDDTEAFHRLVCGIRGVAPGPGNVAEDETLKPVKGSSSLNLLPQKSYDHFTGRDQELEQIIAALREPERHRLIGLYGLGGIGKTALAREAADRSLQAGQFHQAVWVSAKTERFEGVGTEKLPVSDLTLESLLDDIARQCHLPGLLEQSSTEKLQSVQALLASQPILIVLDNLETVADYETLVSRMDNLLCGQSKLLLTSRHEVKHTDIYALRLSGLGRTESIAFLQAEARSRGTSAITGAPEEMLADIHKVTGGAPLAMKLIIGQLSRQPLEVVLKDLKEASFESQDYTFYRFVFKHSWDLLSLEAKKALVSMSVFDPAAGGPVQMVLQVSKVNKVAFYPAMDELIAMSLVDFGGTLGHRRYTLHQLTHYFILSDIVKKWG